MALDVRSVRIPPLLAAPLAAGINQSPIDVRPNSRILGYGSNELWQDHSPLDGISMVEPQPTIAVVDDDEDIRKSLRRLLRSAGFEAITFASAEDYLASISDCTAACLLLDVRLPGQSGIALHQRLTDDQHLIPTVLMSAHENELANARSAAADAVAYLRKPFDAEELLDAVQKALGNCQPL
jgi:CheY-like chemotaxis protein